MQVFNSGINIDAASATPSVFLAGPSERDDGVTAWRKKALSLFKKFGFTGHVYVPEPWSRSRDVQINWEIYHLNLAKCVLFWIPRDLKTLPGFTTNIEFGEWLHSGKVVLGFPKKAERMEYIAYRAKQNGIPVADNLSDTVKNAIAMATADIKRSSNADFYALGDKI